MVAFNRVYKDGKYTCQYNLVDLSIVANDEKKVPLDWLMMSKITLMKNLSNMRFLLFRVKWPHQLKMVFQDLLN